MSDANRGSYASEPPLAFDSRRPRRGGGGPAPVTLILSVLLLAGVAGGVYYMYRGGLRGANDAPRPVGRPLNDVRTVAPPQATTADPAAGLSIYKDDPNAAPGAPAFVAPPEQPTPRPAPTPATASASAVVAAPAAESATATPLPVAPVAPPQPKAAPLKAVPVKAAPAKTPHAQPDAIDKLLAETLDKPAKPGHDKARADGAKADDGKSAANPAKAQADKSGPAVVQIGAFSSQVLADKSWNQAHGVGGGAMAGKTKRVTPVTKPDGSTVYRTAIGGFASRQDAQALCDKLKASGQTCFVR